MSTKKKKAFTPPSKLLKQTSPKSKKEKSMSTSRTVQQITDEYNQVCATLGNETIRFETTKNQLLGDYVRLNAEMQEAMQRDELARVAEAQSKQPFPEPVAASDEPSVPDHAADAEVIKEVVDNG